MSQDKIEILYIGGCSRSGSTLLERMLGQIDGYHAVGEVWHVWSRGFKENQLCGCQQPYRECPFWNAVVEEAFGGFHKVNLDEIQTLKQNTLRVRHLPLLTFPFLQTPQYRQQLKSYADVLQRLYEAISKVSGSRFIVDSSKFPHYAAILNNIPNVNLHVVHLVRDSRATAYSWQRKRVRPEVHWQTTYMDSHGPVGSAVEWSAMNYLLQSLQQNSQTYMMMRYEDFVEHPRDSIIRIQKLIGDDRSDLDFFHGEHKVRLGVNHTVSGNPNRFQKGDVQILPDDEWHIKMARSQKLAVTAFTWPLLLKYGYLQNGRNQADAAPISDKARYRQ